MIPTSKPGKKPSGRPSVKATFYLTREVLSSLEEARLKLREMARPEGRAKITKSLIVEVAIQLAIDAHTMFCTLTTTSSSGAAHVGMIRSNLWELGCYLR
jgi:hypothetical protein